MDLGIAGRVALVMAGSRGIGLATARTLAREGARVAICGRDSQALAAATPMFAIQADVATAAGVDHAVAATRAALGPSEILVVNAGGPPPAVHDNLDDAAWSRAFELTFLSAVRAARLVLPDMRGRRWGRIVIISSYGIKQPVPGLMLSNSIRMAVQGWAKTLAREVAADGVLVNTVCPGWILTNRVEAIIAADADPDAGRTRIAAAIPLGRLGQADEVANLIAFLASERAGYMTGTAIAVDGGLVEGHG